VLKTDQNGGYHPILTGVPSSLRPMTTLTLSRQILALRPGWTWTSGNHLSPQSFETLKHFIRFFSPQTSA
jgi:hypothetical protein